MQNSQLISKPSQPIFNTQIQQSTVPEFQQKLSSTVSSKTSIETSIETSLNQFIPTMTGSQTKLCTFSPSAYDSFIKTIQLVDNDSYINIIDSQICTTINKGLATLVANLESIIKVQLSLTILNPVKVLRSLKQIKGNYDVFIIDDPELSRYIVTNGHLKVFIPKQLNETIENVVPPQISTGKLIGSQVVIDKVTANTIKTLVSKEESINILIHQGLFKGIHIPDVAIYLFEPYITEQIDETTADFLLKSYAFLPLSSIETYNIQIYEVNNVYYIVHVCNTGLLTINTFENLMLVTNEVLI